MEDSTIELKEILTIAGIVISVFTATIIAYLANWWRNNKSFSYQIISNDFLFNVSYEIKHRVKVLLDDKPVENVRLIVVKFINTGRVPIEDKDFVVPIAIDFGKDAEILTSEISATEPLDLPTKIVLEKQTVSLEPLMLNSSDSITIKTLISKSDPFVKITGRIKGIAQISKQNTRNGFWRFMYELFGDYIKAFVFLLVYGLVGLISYGIFSYERLGFFRFILGSIPIILFFIGIFYGLYLLIGKSKSNL